MVCLVAVSLVLGAAVVHYMGCRFAALDSSFHSAGAILCAILPTHHESTHELWFDEALALWRSVRGNLQWDTQFLDLFTRLAKHRKRLRIPLDPVFIFFRGGFNPLASYFCQN